MKTRTLISTTAGLAALLLATAAFAQGGPGPRGRGRGMGAGPGGMAGLQLSDQQQATIRGLRQQAMEDTAPAREDLGEMGQALRELWSARQPNAEAILAQQGRMDALRATIRDRMTELRAEVDQVLTAEQRAEARQLHGDRAGRGGGRRGRGPGAGGPGMGRGMGGPGMGGPGIGRGMGGPGMGRGMGDCGMGGPGAGGRGDRFAEGLDLTAAQQSQIQALRARASEATASARAELAQVREAFQAARGSAGADEAALSALRSRADAARRVVREQEVRTRVAILRLLTDAQRAELQSRGAERSDRAGRGRGRHAAPGAAAE